MLKNVYDAKTDKGLNAYQGSLLAKFLRRNRVIKGWSQERLAEEANSFLAQDPKPEWVPKRFTDVCDRFYILYLERGASVPWTSKTRLRAVTEALELPWLEVLERCGMLYGSDFGDEEEGEEEGWVGEEE